MFQQIINDIIKECPVCSKLKRPTQINCKNNCWSKCNMLNKYFDSGISPKYINNNIKDYLKKYTVNTLEEANVCNESVNICLDFCENRFMKNCIKLSGSFKCGKDFLENTMLKVFVDKGFSCLNLGFSDVVEQSKKGESFLDIVDNYDVVGILDLGSEYSKSESRFVEKTLLGLLNKFSFNCTKTIITTHLSMQEILEQYGPQVHEIFDSDYIGVKVVGKIK